MSDSLYEQLAGLRKRTRKISITLGEIDRRSGDIKPIADDTVEFQVHMLSPEESTILDSIMDQETPPPIHESSPGPNGVGLVQRIVGYNSQDPDYQNRRAAKMSERDAHAALLGCDALMESTPGADLTAKAANLRSSLPHSVLTTIANEIFAFTIAFESVEDFFSTGASNDSPASAPSNAEDSQEAPSSPRKRRR